MKGSMTRNRVKAEINNVHSAKMYLSIPSQGDESEAGRWRRVLDIDRPGELSRNWSRQLDPRR